MGAINIAVYPVLIIHISDDDIFQSVIVQISDDRLARFGQTLAQLRNGFASAGWPFDATGALRSLYRVIRLRGGHHSRFVIRDV